MKPETLADMILKETYRPHGPILRIINSRSPEQLRRLLIQARKFILDQNMSRFLADLTHIPFAIDSTRRPELMHSLRHSARLPFPITWIEFDFHAFRQRSIELGAKDLDGRAIAPPEECPPTVGFLLEEHGQVSSAVKLTEFFPHPVCPMPYSFVWQTSDDPLPWHADTNAGMFVHGIIGLVSPQFGVLYDDSIKNELKQPVVVGPTLDSGLQFLTHPIVIETSGTGRYMICLLAALNDIPVLQVERKQNRGFIARGQYRKFMDYAVLKLNVPSKTNTLKLAKKLVALARRRAHMVRGHWRNFTYEGEVKPCDPSFHTWSPADQDNHSHCQTCGAKRTWIDQHQRGDASLGWVTHDYSVVHEV